MKEERKGENLLRKASSSYMKINLGIVRSTVKIWEELYALNGLMWETV